MKKWIYNYNLEIMTVILEIVFGVSLLMFAYSIFIIIQINKAGGLLVWQWIIGFVLALLGFAIMERFFLKTAGLTFVDFRKMAMSRVLGKRKWCTDNRYDLY